MTAPTAEETYFLEIINETRLDPLGSADRYIVSYTNGLAVQANVQSAIDYFGVDTNALYSAYAALVPAGPLAWSTELATAAHKHSARMIASDEQSHQLPGEAGLGARVNAEGYAFTLLRENVYAYSDDVIYAHAGFMIDWGFDAVDYSGSTLNGNFAAMGDGMQDDAGHRVALLDSALLEVGIDITYENNPNTEVGPQIVTQDFGARGDYFVTGVIYSDGDDDGFYSVGEGRGDFAVRVGQIQTSAWASGAYRAELSRGSNSFELDGGGLSGTVSITATIDTNNIKIDVVDGDTIRTSGSIDVTGPVAKIVALGLSGLVLKAGSGAQEFYGTVGNDTFDGGAGDDVAVYTGSHASYTVAAAANGVTISGSASGTDTARSIEIFRFDDGDFFFDQSTGSLSEVGAEPQNRAPVIEALTPVQTAAGSPVSFTVSAADPDGDALFYSAGNPANGSVTVGADGFITYTPVAGFSGQDQFSVTVSDGKNGVAAVIATVQVAAAPAEPSAAEFNLFTPEAFFGEIGGSGNVFGTHGEEFIAVMGTPDNIVFDPSFNRGGDEIRFPNLASSYSVRFEGSQLIIRDDVSVYSIPIGPNATILSFSDGSWSMRYDAASRQVKIAGQTVTGQAAAITAAPDNPAGPDAVSTDSAKLQLSNDAQVDVAGLYSIFGTGPGEEVVSYTQGSLTFDPSFNRGGDALNLPGAVSQWSAYINGSSIELISAFGEISIPVGPAGMTIDFAGDARVLRYDASERALKLGDETITATTKSTAQQLGAGSGPDIDAGSVSVPAILTLDSEESYSFVDDVTVQTNVVIENFDENDWIVVNGAASNEFSFGSGSKDSDGLANDLTISFSDGVRFTNIVIKDVIANPGFVFDEATAEAAAGWNFITFS